MVSDCWPPVFSKGHRSPKRIYTNISIHLLEFILPLYICHRVDCRFSFLSPVRALSHVEGPLMAQVRVRLYSSYVFWKYLSLWLLQF